VVKTKRRGPAHPLRFQGVLRLAEGSKRLILSTRAVQNPVIPITEHRRKRDAMETGPWPENDFRTAAKGLCWKPDRTKSVAHGEHLATCSKSAVDRGFQQSRRAAVMRWIVVDPMSIEDEPRSRLRRARDQ
jgi:hypothetical protein